ncbi:MAG: septum formation protein Maf [Clostridia bacterium]|nr:septum formation protein Maf [Clostridia bacterium]
MIYLASKSPRRKEILKTAGIDFKVISADADEDCTFSPDVQDLVMGLAWRKLRAVREKVKSDDIIIAADTVVCYDGIVLTKPQDEQDAFRMLSMLSGDFHEVYTGFVVSRADRYIADYDVTRVKMRDISSEEIMKYIASGECDDKAGAYAIQGMGSVFIERIEGSYHNVVGLPICKVFNALKELSGKDQLVWQSI